jgi:hypothetical protein
MESEFLKRLFDPVEQREARSHLSVPNGFGFEGQLLFRIQMSPDLPAIFLSDHPDPPFRTPPAGWSEKSLADKRVILAAAYSLHLSPDIRRQTIELVRGEKSMNMSQILVNSLCDPAKEVRAEAAACLWAWHGEDGCKFPVLALRDEIRGYTQTILGQQSEEGLLLGRDKAIAALDFLVASAPTGESRRKIEALIRDRVIIEERIPDVDTRSVKFLGKEQKDIYTYEVYRAKNRQQALAFLKGKTVTVENYYIEVETMEGNLGRDIKGIYELPSP